MTLSAKKLHLQITLVKIVLVFSLGSKNYSIKKGRL